MNTFIKPLYHGVFHLTYALQVSKVLLKLVTIRRHALQSIVVTNVFLVGQLLEEARFPGD